MSNDFDFKPDWDAYNNMDEDERQARKELLRLFHKYNNGKISYEKYISEIDDPFYYSILSDREMKEIKDFKNQKRLESEEKKHIKYTKQLIVRSKPTTSYYLFFFVVFVCIIAFLISLKSK